MTAIEPTSPTSLAPAVAGQPARLGVAVSDQRGAEFPGEASQSGPRRSGVPFVASLPLRLDVKVPMPEFRLKDLTHLTVGQVLETEWSVAEDLPVSVGDIKLLWAEFAVADQQLTVRVTRIA